MINAKNEKLDQIMLDHIEGLIGKFVNEFLRFYMPWLLSESDKVKTIENFDDREAFVFIRNLHVNCLANAISSANEGFVITKIDEESQMVINELYDSSIMAILARKKIFNERSTKE